MTNDTNGRGPGGADDDARPTRRASLGARVALSFVSLGLTLALLEGLFRAFVPAPAPVRLRDGLYMNTLGKVDGFDTRTTYRGEPLSMSKRPGEIRVAVFGESTVQGSPWEGFGSPPAMLLDHLRRELPGRDITVVNMGRGSGYTMDSYYFLASLRRFGLDYVVIYQGANDEFRVDHEMCLPSTHPHLHRAWRWLAEHSRLAWTVRAVGPGWLVKMKHGKKGPTPVPNIPNFCDSEAGYKAWIDAIAETAEGFGARVVIASAVSNPLRWAEQEGQFGLDKPLALDTRNDGYRALLACMLDPGCDIAGTFARVQASAPRSEGPGAHEPGRPRFPPIGWLEPRARLAMQVASERGARGIDFHRYITEHAHGGLDPLLFVDEMHLTLEGEWLLSWLWAREIASLADGRERAKLPPPLDPGPYLAAVKSDQRRGVPCIYFWTVPVFLRANMPLVGSTQLRLALRTDPPQPATGLSKTRAGLAAQLVSGWLKGQLGVDPGLPPTLAALLPAVSVQGLSKELTEKRDCSTVLGAPLGALVTDKTGGWVGEGDGAPPTDAKKVVSWVIGPKQDEAIAKMLGGLSPAGCRVGDISPDKTVIHVEFECEGGRRVPIDLHHAEDAAGAIARTDRFAVVAPGAAPPPGFVEGVARGLATTEAAFHWTRAEALDATPAATP